MVKGRGWELITLVCLQKNFNEEQLNKECLTPDFLYFIILHSLFCFRYLTKFLLSNYLPYTSDRPALC